MTVEKLIICEEDLKAEIWRFMEINKIEHKGLKSAVNEVLDLLDELEDKITAKKLGAGT